MKINFLTRKDNNYPELLKETVDPPAGLYWLGEQMEGTMLSVVGARKVTSYGLAVVDQLLGGLAGTNTIIVSGLAFGVDAAAHKAAIKYGLKTIAVLPSGVDDPHPRTNAYLAREILKHGGALVSEYMPGTTPQKSHFPVRNRIIAGISRATLVVEAGERSGSLITARLALEANRDVLAVPGSIFSPVSAGTHRLISLGARLVEGSDDIIDELGLDKASEGNICRSLEGVEREVFRQIHLGVNSADLLIEGLSIAPNKLTSILTDLELEGFVKKMNNKYVAIGANN